MGPVTCIYKVPAQLHPWKAQGSVFVFFFTTHANPLFLVFGAKFESIVVVDKARKSTM
jgi:hypothetical protein